jgi:3',5'-cyclic AMP phosphodiesterase CpdA
MTVGSCTMKKEEARRGLLLLLITLALLAGCAPPDPSKTAPGSSLAPATGSASSQPTSSPPLGATITPEIQPPSGVFLVKPYLQLGDQPTLSAQESLHLLWHTAREETRWSVEYRGMQERGWRKADPPVRREVAVRNIAPHFVYSATLRGLKPGEQIAYRLLREGQPVFSATARARASEGQPYRFAVFADCGTGGGGQASVAYQVYQTQPHFVVIPGDIVYDRGRISEYRENFFSYYNADRPSARVGAPLMRSTLFLAGIGNHDVYASNLRRYPDGLAYFYYWSQPLNGPAPQPGALLLPALSGSDPDRQAFLNAAGANYPRMANFSFRYGNSFWLVIDSNPYRDWTDASQRAWIQRQFDSAKSATWRFVVFHHPGFSSSKRHFGDQWMRQMTEMFERAGVDVVFSGHVHNYQRTYPMRFAAARDAQGKLLRARGEVRGSWTLDRRYDGVSQTTPQGVIYIVTGAGGAGLYNREQQDDPASWQEFTRVYHARTHSFTLIEINGKTLTARQISAAGRELDRFVITK